MYPAQTSFIPITVALSRFIESNGFEGLYPYWYLGTTPVKYLTGPVVPGILIGLHKLLSDFSFFDLSLLLVVGGQLLMAVGWGAFAWNMSGKRHYGFIVLLLTLLLPWHWVSSLGLAEVSAVLASALTPWVLLAFASSVRHIEKTFVWLPSLAFALLLLTNSTVAIPAVLGLLIISISNIKYQISNIKKAAVIILLGWVLATVWYGPGYWLTTLGAPSIGGKSAVSAFVTLINLMRGFVPVILALILVWWKIRPKNIFEKFTLIWLTTFGSLTLFRFMADPDFWMDWTAWMGEVEVGLALVVAKMIYDLRFTIYDKKKFLILNSLILILGFGWFLIWQKRDFWLPRKNIDNTVEYKIANWFSNNSTVFLSGTTAFWLNSLVDVAQVRGGRDEVSKNHDWRALNWQLTQGENLSDAVASLKGLGVEYLVVHSDKSGEYYHDFIYPQKFENIPTLEKVYDREGDIIYNIKY